MSLVAVLGTGSVGRAIALSLARGGANVSLVSRTPSQVEPLDGVTVISYEEATSDVDAIVIAVPGGALEDLLATQASWLDGAFLVEPLTTLRARPTVSLPSSLTTRRRPAWRARGARSVGRIFSTQ